MFSLLTYLLLFVAKSFSSSINKLFCCLYYIFLKLHLQISINLCSNFICLIVLLMRPAVYALFVQEAFTEAFVQHYSRISTVLSSAIEHDTVTNRVVHISVQLFSNEVLATRMVSKHNLLQMVISSLMHLLQAVLMPSTITGDLYLYRVVIK